MRRGVCADNPAGEALTLPTSDVSQSEEFCEDFPEDQERQDHHINDMASEKNVRDRDALTVPNLLERKRFDEKSVGHRSRCPTPSRDPRLIRVVGALRTQPANDFTRTPHLALGDLLQLLFELLAIVWAAVRFERSARLFAGLHRLV